MRAFRCGYAHYKQRILCCLCGFSERLCESELSLESSCWQVRGAMQLTRIGYPFIDQDQGWAVFLEQFAQHITRAGGLLIIGLYASECLLAAQLPCQLAPQCAHHGAIGLRNRIARRNLVSDQDNALCLRQSLYASVCQQSVHASKFPRRYSGEQVIQRQH